MNGDSWIEVKDGNLEAREMFRRHYSYNRHRDQLSFNPARERNRNLFVGPGQKMVLMSADGSALFVWRKFISADHQEGVNCAVFRNEGSARASDLIRAAMRLAWERWPGSRLYTYVDPKRIKSEVAGYCFRRAGWKSCGRTKSRNLVILEFRRCSNCDTVRTQVADYDK